MAAKTSWHRQGTKLRHCHPIYKSLFTEENGGAQKHRSENINTNKAKTATKSITVVDTCNYVIIILRQT